MNSKITVIDIGCQKTTVELV